jgi:hypothetical protein
MTAGGGIPGATEKRARLRNQENFSGMLSQVHAEGMWNLAQLVTEEYYLSLARNSNALASLHGYV